MCASAMFSHELPLIFISFYCGDFFFSAQPIKLRLKPYKCEWKVKYKFNSLREFLLENFLFSQFPTSTKRAMLWVSLPFICFKNRWSLTAIFILLLEIEFYISFLLRLVAEIERGEMVLKSFYAIPSMLLNNREANSTKNKHKTLASDNIYGAHCLLYQTEIFSLLKRRTERWEKWS